MPILPALANNGSVCGDYELRPRGAFLASTAGIVAHMIGPEAGDAFVRSWKTLRNYVVPNPAAKDTRIIVINTNFFSATTEMPAARWLTAIPPRRHLSG